MCLAVPMCLTQRDEMTGTAELDGIRREISVMLVPEAQIGDWVLVHAGYAIGTLDEHEAQETLSLLREVAALGEQP